MYHYTMCGLDNVWLENGYTVKKTAYGNAVSITHAEELHGLIASDLICKTGRLTGKEFRFLRTHLALSQAGVAQMLGVTEQSVSLWERTGKVPLAMDRYLRLIWIGKHNPSKTIASVIDRINTVERIIHQKIVAKETKSKWKSHVENTDSDGSNVECFAA